MRIALIGYGKMGKVIESIALSKHHQIVLKIDIGNPQDFTKANLQKADVAIEFTRPDAAVENIKKCLEFGVPVVIGTTGWLQELDNIQKICQKKDGAMLWASNFSIGVNIFFEMNRYLAQMMNHAPQYEVTTEEIHHTHKLDAPSGTSITIAQDLIAILDKKQSWVNHSSKNPNELEIISKRIDPAPGTHTINYHSNVDSIEIKHTAHSREGFAAGAVAAAEWLVGKKGCFQMRDMLASTFMK
jgi:4-hydroxy-tetrahydrodipicolinate reductase